MASHKLDFISPEDACTINQYIQQTERERGVKLRPTLSVLSLSLIYEKKSKAIISVFIKKLLAEPTRK